MKKLDVLKLRVPPSLRRKVKIDGGEILVRYQACEWCLLQVLYIDERKGWISRVALAWYAQIENGTEDESACEQWHLWRDAEKGR